MMIVPLLTYTGIVNLHLTCIQSQKLKSIEKRAMKIINVTSLPSIEKMFHKESCILVRKCLEHRTCSNFRNYFEINQHMINTRNDSFMIKLPKVNLEV